MAFLDNSGNIILDAVLTDTGRKRLARGNGSFNITKFALSDEEIDYGTFKPLLTHPDLEIMETPILEAFTNNTSMMHSFLQTYSNNASLLYLPVLKLNTLQGDTHINSTFNSYLVAVDAETACGLTTGGLIEPGGDWVAADDGIWYGYAPSQIGTHCRIDQGIDNAAVPPTDTLSDWEMYENQYLVEMDSRFGRIVSGDGKKLASHSFVDDDGIAIYYFAKSTDDFVTDNTTTSPATTANEVIAGARGTIFQFQIQVSAQLQTSNTLFTRLGGEFQAAKPGTDAPGCPCWFIDSIIRVTGLTTGYSIDVPIRYVKAQLGHGNCFDQPRLVNKIILKDKKWQLYTRQYQIMIKPQQEHC